MDATQLPIPPQESTDIFSLSDQVLSDSLHFVEEVPELLPEENHRLISLFCRSVLGTGAAFGYVVPSPLGPRN
jgi:hypothetical protein